MLEDLAEGKVMFLLDGARGQTILAFMMRDSCVAGSMRHIAFGLDCVLHCREWLMKKGEDGDKHGGVGSSQFQQ